MSSPRVQIIITRICAIPDDYNRRGDISLGKLLADSGYEAFRDEIDGTKICQHLESHPHLIKSWAGYSSDKTQKTGWYFDDSEHMIGRYSSDARRSRERKFSKCSQACAEFILHELEYIRDILRPKPWWRFW